MFNFLNLRLQQIIGSNQSFGGVSIITVGDLFQLKPVYDKWIFENSERGYGPLASNIWKEYFTLFERRVLFTGHIPQVKVQVIMLQINKQDQMCLLALIITQNVL